MRSKNGAFFQKPAILILMALICCALWGSAFPCVKIGYQMFHIETTGSQILFAGYRFFLAGVLTFLIGSGLERKPLLLKKASIPYVFGQGLIQTTAQYVCFYIGLAHTTGSKGSVLNSSSAFFSILIAHFVLKQEKMTLKKALGCLVGFGGVVLINLSPGAWGNGFSMAGEGMILICSIVYGASSDTLKLISHRETPTTLTAYQLLFGGGVLILIGFLSGGRVQGFTPASTLLLIYMALLSTVAFTLWAALLKYNPVGKIAIFGFSIPVFGILFSGIFLHESFLSVKNLIALLLVVIGIIIVNLHTSVLTRSKQAEKGADIC